MSITVDTNLTVINFLDVSLDLNNSYKSYTKPIDRIGYINVGSCHPLIVLKNLVKNITKRISSLSSSVNIFNNDAQYIIKLLKIAVLKRK